MKNKLKKSLLLIFIFLIVSIVNSTKAEASTINNITFDSRFYAEQNGDLMNAFGYNDGALYNHYANFGINEGRMASLFFDVNYYKSTYADLRQAFGNNNRAYYDHFVNFGMVEGRTASMFLDVNFYKSKYADLRQAFGNNNRAYYEHFVNFGINEGRQASTNFDVKYYLNNNADLKQAFGNNYKEAMKHYLRFGKNEGRKSSSSSNNNGENNNTDYIPTPDKNGRKIIPQKELAKCITKVPITTANWQQYFELKDIENIDKNAFGEVTHISRYTRLDMTKDNTYYSTTLEFEITNKNLMSDYSWNYNNGECRKKIMSFRHSKHTNNSGLRYYEHSFSGQSFPYLQNQSTSANIYDTRITINDIKINRVTGYVYFFNVPDNFFTVDEYNDRYLYIEKPDNKYNGYEKYRGDCNSEYCHCWIMELGEDIENETFKDINLNVNDNTIQPNEKQYMNGYEVMGNIEIPKTNVKLPILEKTTKKSLETSVAILYGVGLNQVGNTTIVGHNYRNGTFFSDNKNLSKGDIIYITDQIGVKITYQIYDIFETDPSDAEYMKRDTKGSREISLSTTTDDSSKRLVILAKEV